LGSLKKKKTFPFIAQNVHLSQHGYHVYVVSHVKNNKNIHMLD